LNAVFVIGFSLVLISIAELGGFFRGSLAIGLCLVWMSTRIQLSNWSHDMVCSECDEVCEEKN
jgi:hypothetical protein